MGKFLERVKGIPPVDETSLEDWSDSNGSSSSAIGFGMAIHAIPCKDESPHALTALGTSSNEQVAYRHHATKQTGPLHIKSGPKQDFKHLGVIEGYMCINGHKVHALLDRWRQHAGLDLGEFRQSSPTEDVRAKEPDPPSDGDVWIQILHPIWSSKLGILNNNDTLTL